MPSIAVIGASNDRSKFGNKCVRAYVRLGWTVHPVHPTEREIEGLAAYASIVDAPRPIDRVALYLPPPRVMKVLPEIARTGCKDVFFNPGTESDEALELARQLGLNPIEACTIVWEGERP